MTMTEQDMSGSAHWRMAVAPPFEWGLKDSQYGTWGVRNTFLQFYDVNEDMCEDASIFQQRRASSLGSLCASAESRKEAAVTLGRAQLQEIQDSVSSQKIAVTSHGERIQIPNDKTGEFSEKPRLRAGRLRTARGVTSATMGNVKAAKGAAKVADSLVPDKSPEAAVSAVLDERDAASEPGDAISTKACASRNKTVYFGCMRSDKSDRADPEDSGTTVMIRHIACRYTKEQMVSFLDKSGLKDKYDFVHLPLNPVKRANLGYVFVNFLSAEYAEECRQIYHGKVLGTSCTQKKCEVVPAHMQGFARVPRHSGSLEVPTLTHFEPKQKALKNTAPSVSRCPE
jgi:hypothetical protein